MEFSKNQNVSVGEMIALCLSNNGVKGKFDFTIDGSAFKGSRVRRLEKLSEFGVVRFEYNGNKYISTFKCKRSAEGLHYEDCITKIKMHFFCVEGTENN